MKLIIESDGTSIGTSVKDAETGEIVKNVVGLNWTCKFDEGGNFINKLVIELYHPSGKFTIEVPPHIENMLKK